MHKTIYTTGLTGFIGRNLQPLLLDNYDTIINFGRDNQAVLIDKSGVNTQLDIQEVTSKYRGELLIHLATLYLPNPKSLMEVRALTQSNIFFILDIIESFFADRKIEIINISSYMQLLNPTDQNSYSLSKEMVSSFLNRNHICKNVYLFDSFGKGDKRNKVTDVFIKNILTNNIITIPSNDISINLSHVSDICHAIIKSLKLPSGDYCVMSNNTLTLVDLIEKIEKITGLSANIQRSDKAENTLERLTVIPENIFTENITNTLNKRLENQINEIKKA